MAGSDPAWRAGSILYATGGEIHRIQPDGSGDETITSDFVDSSPAGAPGVTAFVRTADGGDDDIWLIVDGQTVAVSASDQNPENLRLDLYYVCGGQSMPIAVGLARRSDGRHDGQLPGELRPEPELRGRHDRGGRHRWLPPHHDATGHRRAGRL